MGHVGELGWEKIEVHLGPFVGQLSRKKPVERPRRRWLDNERDANGYSRKRVQNGPQIV